MAALAQCLERSLEVSPLPFLPPDQTLARYAYAPGRIEGWKLGRMRPAAWIEGKRFVSVPPSQDGK